MDLLSDLLRHSGLRKRVFTAGEIRVAEPQHFPCGRSFGLHVVSRGRLRIRAEGDGPELRLGPGDIALMARGCHHTLYAEAPQPGESQADARVLSAAYQLWSAPLHPFFSELPDWLVLRAEERLRLDSVGLLVDLISAELAELSPGSESVLNGLLDAVFSYVLRALLLRCADRGPGFGRALRSEAISRALQRLHTEVERDWSLESLAREVGLSRTALANRFREDLGETPMGYLRRLRMLRASQRLLETDLPLERIATEVGYSDAFGFSRVFKKTLGKSPREFRRSELAPELASLRFEARFAG